MVAIGCRSYPDKYPILGLAEKLTSNLKRANQCVAGPPNCNLFQRLREGERFTIMAEGPAGWRVCRNPHPPVRRAVRLASLTPAA